VLNAEFRVLSDPHQIVEYLESRNSSAARFLFLMAPAAGHQRRRANAGIIGSNQA
jgi:hypothetical protein